MPQSYTPPGSGNPVTVPEFDDFANGVVAFKQFADSLAAIGATVPVGTIMPYVGSSAPSGWFLCNGAEVDAVQNPVLATLCASDKFGAAAVGKVKLPDLRARFVLGTSPTYGLATTGGAASVTLTESQMPSHKHNVNFVSGEAGEVHTHSMSISGAVQQATVSHSHGVTVPSDGEHTHGAGHRTATNFVRTGTGTGLVPEETVSSMTRTSSGGAHGHTPTVNTDSSSHTHLMSFTGNTGNASAKHSHAISGDSALTGSGTAVSILPPYLSLNYIIKAG